MELINISPLAGMSYSKVGPRGEAWQVAVVRGAFSFVPGQPLQFEDESIELVMADVYHGEEPTTSALRHETDLVWTKPVCDVIVAGHAHAPLGRAASRWQAAVQLGKQRHAMTITGPRQWRKRLTGWHLDAPALALSVPLDYGLAFGGDPTLGQPVKPGAASKTLPDNPVGVGYYQKRYMDSAQTYAAPQFEVTGKPYTDFDAKYPVLGFSPLSRWWPSRYRHAGTMDAQWEKNGFPYLPDNFDTRFYNGAPQSLQIPHPKGGEEIALLGLWPTDGAHPASNAHGAVHTSLPQSFPEAQIHTISTVLPSVPMTLDTIVIDTDARRVYLSWRVVVAQSGHPQLCAVRWPAWQQEHMGNAPESRSENRLNESEAMDAAATAHAAHAQREVAHG
jgi:hypothetical protein